MGLKSGQLFLTIKLYNWLIDRKDTPVEELVRSKLQSEEEFTDQRSSHFQLCIAVNFKSL